MDRIYGVCCCDPATSAAGCRRKEEGTGRVYSDRPHWSCPLKSSKLLASKLPEGVLGARRQICESAKADGIRLLNCVSQLDSGSNESPPSDGKGSKPTLQKLVN